MVERNGQLSPKINILIVDDHPIMRDGLARLFAFVEDIVVVGEAATGEQAIEKARELRPHVVLLDINLPVLNGLQVTSLIKSTYHDEMSVIMLTAHDDKEQIVHAMRAGASAYCSKEIETPKLIETIRQVARGFYVIGGKVYNERGIHEWLSGQVEALSGPFMADAGEHFVPLSPREMEILRCVTHGLSNKEIAVELGISHQTVKNHMTSILDKLGVEDRTQAAVYALQRGWVRVIERGQQENADE
jgi:DNA-binding NarL/FixJ family response regulator